MIAFASKITFLCQYWIMYENIYVDKTIFVKRKLFLPNRIGHFAQIWKSILTSAGNYTSVSLRKFFEFFYYGAWGDMVLKVFEYCIHIDKWFTCKIWEKIS